MKFDERERNTILAALRHWQRGRCWSDHEMVIATDYGTLPMLNNREIDELYMRLVND